MPGKNLMDITNHIVKICRRLEEVEYLLSISEGRTQTELDELYDEREILECDLEKLKPATSDSAP